MVYSLKHGIYAHPFELSAAVSTLLAVFGAFKLLVYEPETLEHISEGILSLPSWLLWTWVGSGAIGATCVLIGLTMSIFSPRGREIEEVGLWLMGAMWLSAGVARFFLDIAAWEEYVRYFVIAFACALRLGSIHNYQGLIRQHTEEVEVV